MSRLYTMGEVAALLTVPIHRVRYVVQSRGIHTSRVGITRVFTDDDVERIRQELATVARRPPTMQNAS